MHTAVRLLVLAPLLVVGCKKKEPEVAAAPVAPAVEWAFGPATQVGAAEGTLTIPLKVTVHGDKALIVRSWDVGVETDAGRVCVLKSTGMEKVEANATGEINLRGDCDATRLPEADEAKLVGTIDYATVGGDEQHMEVRQKVALRR